MPLSNWQQVTDRTYRCAKCGDVQFGEFVMEDAPARPQRPALTRDGYFCSARCRGDYGLRAARQLPPLPTLQLTAEMLL
jgi:hypothetical protein